MKTDISTETLELARETLVGDLRDIVLEAVRNIPKVWEKLSETEQLDWIDIVSRRVESVAADAVNIIAADGQQVFAVGLEKVERKDAIKGIFNSPWDSHVWLKLGEAQGGTIQIVPSSIAPYSGERAPPETAPDQPSLPMSDDDEPEMDRKTMAAGG